MVASTRPVRVSIRRSVWSCSGVGAGRHPQLRAVAGDEVGVDGDADAPRHPPVLDAQDPGLCAAEHPRTATVDNEVVDARGVAARRHAGEAVDHALGGHVELGDGAVGIDDPQRAADDRHGLGARHRQARGEPARARGDREHAAARRNVGGLRDPDGAAVGGEVVADPQRPAHGDAVARRVDAHKPRGVRRRPCADPDDSRRHRQPRRRQPRADRDAREDPPADRIDAHDVTAEVGDPQRSVAERRALGDPADVDGADQARLALRLWRSGREEHLHVRVA
jgi:hypothetical protein